MGRKQHAPAELTKSAWRQRVLERTNSEADADCIESFWESPEEIAQDKQDELESLRDNLMEEQKMGLWDDDGDMDDEAFMARDKKKGRQRMRRTLLNEGEDEEMEIDVPEDAYDDVTTTGHHNLEANRERRHYARITAWEMPLLASKRMTVTSRRGRSY